MTLAEHPTPTSESATGRCPVTAFDHNSPDLGEDNLWRAYEALRGPGGVAWSEEHGGFWIITAHAEARAALRDWETFASGWGHRIPVIGTPRAMPIDYDPPIHTDYRRVMAHALAPDRVRELQPFVHRLVDELVSDFHAAGGGDAVAAIALPMPLRMLTQVAGFSEGTVSQFRRLTEEMWAEVNHTDYDEARKGLRLLVEDEVDRHRAERPDDYLTWLLDAQVGDRAIDDDELARVLLTLAIAGHETTMNAASSLLWLLASDTGLQERLRGDPALAPAYVEEMLRLRTPAQNFARRTTRAVEVGGVQIPEDSRVLISLAAADRDGSVFADPTRFDADRSTRGHLAFGWGIHQCIGASLARAELRTLLETLCTYPPIRLAGEVRFSALQGGIHYGPTSLPLRFEAEGPVSAQ